MSRKKPGKPPALRVVGSDQDEARTRKSKSPRLPAPPKRMSGYARTEWLRLSKDLHAQGLLTHADRAAMEQLCEAYAVARRGREILAQQAKEDPDFSGLVVATTNGNLIQNPILGVINRASEQVMKITVEFGMTPASRSKVVGREDQREKEPADDYFDW